VGALHQKGHSYEDIGGRPGRDGKTVGKHVREYLERRGKESPPDSEIQSLKALKDRYKVLIELDKIREEHQRVPKRLDDLEATVKALSADQNQLQAAQKKLSVHQEGLLEWFRSLPISNLGTDWVCSRCGSPKYVMVKVECSRCGYETAWGHAS